MFFTRAIYYAAEFTGAGYESCANFTFPSRQRGFSDFIAGPAIARPRGGKAVLNHLITKLDDDVTTNSHEKVQIRRVTRVKRDSA
jgi:hypothetical protein